MTETTEHKWTGTYATEFVKCYMKISDEKVKEITGHTKEEILERYYQDDYSLMMWLSRLWFDKKIWKFLPQNIIKNAVVNTNVQPAAITITITA
ncbi:MAG TPA: hypothetical protein VN368_01585 [Candidatus Methylomirabilis sp.]|nr:hypothetical protein [Candidatus Methylomirabilis sp.]